MKSRINIFLLFLFTIGTIIAFAITSKQNPLASWHIHKPNNQSIESKKRDEQLEIDKSIQLATALNFLSEGSEEDGAEGFGDAEHGTKNCHKVADPDQGNTLEPSEDKKMERTVFHWINDWNPATRQCDGKSVSYGDWHPKADVVVIGTIPKKENPPPTDPPIETPPPIGGGIMLPPFDPPTPPCPEFSVESNITKATIGQSDGKITISVSPASAFLYTLLNTGSSNYDGTFDKLKAGNYTIVYLDNDNCGGRFPFTITEAPPECPQIKSGTTTNCTKIVEPYDGSIKVTATTNANHQFQLSNGVALPLNQTGLGTTTFSSLAQGLYTLSIISNNCPETVQQFVISPYLEAENGTPIYDKGTYTVCASKGKMPFTLYVNQNGTKTKVNISNLYWQLDGNAIANSASTSSQTIDVSNLDATQNHTIKIIQQFDDGTKNEVYSCTLTVKQLCGCSGEPNDNSFLAINSCTEPGKASVVHCYVKQANGDIKEVFDATDQCTNDRWEITANKIDIKVPLVNLEEEKYDNSYGSVMMKDAIFSGYDGKLGSFSQHDMANIDFSSCTFTKDGRLASFKNLQGIKYVPLINAKAEIKAGEEVLVDNKLKTNLYVSVEKFNDLTKDQTFMNKYEDFKIRIGRDKDTKELNPIVYAPNISFYDDEQVLACMIQLDVKDVTAEINMFRPTVLEAALMSKYAYGGDDAISVSLNDLNGWIPITPRTATIKTTTSDGLKMQMFTKMVNGEDVYTMAFAGTEDIDDWIQNGLQLEGFSSQYQDAVANGNEFKKFYKQKLITYVGHSLGGGLASIAALVTVNPAITFNAAGVSNNTLKANDLIPTFIDETKIKTYSFWLDFLTILQKGLVLYNTTGITGPMGKKLTILKGFPKNTVKLNHGIDNIIELLR